MIGKVIGQKYRIDKKIGHGGFGDVYKGCDLHLKRDVAIKMLMETGYEDSFRKRFVRESELMARLLHPNIVAVFDCGDYNGRPYLVLEYVNGPSLMEMTEKTGVSMAQAVTLGTQVCHAMAYAHNQGIIHRDLSLKNIMVNDHEEAKILDFGLAKVLHTDAQTTAKIVGTPYFLAPEQITGAPVDHRADIFSFGVGWFRLVNGHFPFEAEHPASVIYQIVHKEDFEFADSVPAELVGAILKCLQKDPGDRYADFNELAGELEKVQRTCLDSTVELPATPVVYVRSSKRNPYLNRVMIKDPRDFFGREREVKRIYSRLDAPHPQSISVVGDRRIGKSSLLNYVYHRKNRKQYMQTYADSIFIYMDLQRSGDLTVADFIDILFSMFKYEGNQWVEETGGNRSLDDLKEVIQELNSSNRRVIILMDEFESITKNQNFDMQFFSFLRFLANNYKVAYVTSSYLDLQQLCHNRDIADSPFFNIFSNLPLRPFSRDEALELIRVPSEREGVPLERYADRVLELSGCFPLYVQVACSNLFEFFVENEGTEPDWKEVGASFREEVYPHYSFVWDKMDQASRETLCRVALGKQIGRKYRYLSEDLIRRGYLKETDGGMKLFSTTFKDFVLEQSQRIGKKKSFLSSLWGKAESGD